MNLWQFLSIFQRECCYLCGDKMNMRKARGWMKDSERATREHVRPKGKGGAAHPDNILLAHRRCNADKASRRPYACEVLFAEVAYEAWRKVPT